MGLLGGGAARQCANRDGRWASQHLTAGMSQAQSVDDITFAVPWTTREEEEDVLILIVPSEDSREKVWNPDLHDVTGTGLSHEVPDESPLSEHSFPPQR